MDNDRSRDERIAYLKETAREVRMRIVDMIFKAQSGHPGGALSATDIVTALYFDILKIDPKNPGWKERDRFVLSKGHACPVWYASLAMKGYFPLEELDTLRRFESILQGHPDKNKTPGVDMTTGSLGQGLSMGVGMALESRMSKIPFNVYVMIGDGELQEGQNWEAAASAAKFGLDNLVAIIDANRLQMDGFTSEVMPMDPIDKKFQAFNWDTMEIDGHDMSQIVEALEKARDNSSGRPLCIIARTVKGKGVSFMEDVREWHGKAPNEAELQQALSELRGA